MTLEFTNATPAKNNNGLSTALLVLSCLFFFVPVSLIVLGYYTSMPTGSLVSPLPQGIISSTPNSVASNTPVIAVPEDKTSSSSANTNSNSSQKTASLAPGQTEAVVSDASITENSQIYLLNKEGDKSLYTVKNKSVGTFTFNSNSSSDQLRSIDYQVVNP